MDTIMINAEKTKAQLRGQITRFINCREKAYKAVRNAGNVVPDMHIKARSINILRAQLAASEYWPLRSHLLWIVAMRHNFADLMPSPFHHDPRQRKYRQRICVWLDWCDDQVKVNYPHLTIQS